MQDIKFYILIPVYNVEKYVEKCVLSAVNQNYSNYEILLVDDGSKDNSGKICDEFSEKYNNIHVIHQENKGLFTTRRITEQYVKQQSDCDTSYIIYLDSDDSLELSALSHIAKVIKNNNNPDMVIYNFKSVTPDGLVMRSDLDDESVSIIEDKRTLYMKVLTEYSYNPLWRKAVSGKLISNNFSSEAYKIKFAEDLAGSLNYYRNARRVVFYNKVLYNYLQNPKSISKDVSVENFPFDNIARKMAWDFVKEREELTAEDKKTYQRYLQTILISRIKRACYLNTSFSKKRDLLYAIRKHSLWNECLEYGTDGAVLKLFKRGNMRTVLVIYQVRKMLGCVKSFVLGCLRKR